MIMKQGYHFLLALQDLYNRPRNSEQKVYQAFDKLFLKVSYRNQLKLILAIMEIEAWFLADYYLFQRINDQAIPDYIKNHLDVDLIHTNPEDFDHPAEIINKIYKLFGQKYKKNEGQAYQIVSKIDFDFLYSDVITQKVRSWNKFVNAINDGFSGKAFL